jgi:transposase
VSHEKTHTEIRNSETHRELIEITEEMQEAMQIALESDAKRFAVGDAPAVDDRSNNFRPYDQRQRFFVDVSKDSFLEEKHPARIIDLVVEGLDLHELYDQYSDEGNPAYHPRMMLKVLFYAYYIGVMSSRTIWDCVINRADFMYLAAGQVPNFRTINSFRLRHLPRLAALFTEIVWLCRKLGMIGFEHLAVDGQKIHANANFKKSKNLKGLRAEYERLKAGLERLLNREINEYVSKDTVDKRASTLAKKLEKLSELQKQLEALKDEEKRVNMTDGDAPVMKHKDGTSRPSYNHQSAVDAKYGVTTAVRTTQSSDRAEDLEELVNASNANTGGSPAEVSADSGFCSYEMLENIENRTEEFYVPDKRFEESKKDPQEKRKYGPEDFPCDEEGNYTCPAGHPMRYVGTFDGVDGVRVNRYVGTACEDCSMKRKCTNTPVRRLQVDTREPYRRKMREKLRSDKGREAYMKRQGLVEPGHGDDQKNRKWKQHHLRGKEKATAEFVLVRIAANLGKLIKFKTDELLATQGT